MKKLNAVVIGCGGISVNHLEAVASCHEVDLYAVCDIDEEKALRTSKKYGCKYTLDYRGLLEDSNVDVVHICTPHYLHAPIAIDAMKNGKHVLTEKPMAISIGDCMEMIRVSREMNKQLGVCFQNRYNSTSVKIKELLDSGRVGAVKGAKAFVTWYRDEKYYTESGWRGSWEKEGGGVLINQSIHTLDLIQWFLGDIDSIKANVDTRILNGVIEVEDTADATIKFKSGARALFYATNCYVSNSPVEIEIICEKAVIKLGADLTVTYASGEVEHFSEEDKATGEKAYWGSSHRVLIHDFYRKISDGESFDLNGEQGIRTIKMIKAIYESSKTRKYIAPEI